MPVTIGPTPSALPQELLEKLARVSFPTLGHYLEEGFADPGIVRLAGTTRVIGRAVTVRTTATDSTMLHHAAGLVEAGDVIVVDTGGDVRHAPLGEVVASALSFRGAAGAIVDGAATDIDEIAGLGLPVYGRGLSMLTTKLHDIDAGGLNIPVVCGGVVVRPGDVVLADANGVLFAPAAVLEQLIDTALEDDAEEPDLVQALRDGGRLGDLTGASATIAGFAS
ncbi:Regulator of RNase E activity RraA [Leifsonia sp. 98AMF]|uniref:RraA family protein n=1 Tax=unclassified Leifsonia TaxID=2663824 RepID=UPI00087A8593|nr:MULTISPECIES: RraA family protein [unclassified Leifsonia]SDH08258.1 Regulator of RNase E activity RraA [Leifsonia sp. 197AMF]SDJ31609.1 Regulator of RNase E activity RraA [Leifsonia sp. 466MF]SDK48418.1 Regulator of RNase E activity RraA [Leifsonia sp. 157MF]SDN52947.1 Regulator of RNase E activity RraA [Leifsonia sp. 509MF]SEN57167.1 Regulator of RNase E activity RraA [Leifsonia sp. 467MF]